MFNRTWR